MVVPSQLINVTLKLLYFFIPEVLTWVFIEKHSNRFKFRFSYIEGHKHLKPFAKTWVVAIVILFITLFSQDIFEFLMGQRVHDWLAGFGTKIGFISLALAGFSFLWIYNYLLEKKWDKVSWVITVGIVILIIFFFSV